MFKTSNQASSLDCRSSLCEIRTISFKNPNFQKIQIIFLTSTIFSSNCKGEEIIHNSTTNSNSEALHFIMKSLEDWNLEDLYLCPGFFGELTIEKAKEILKEAYQDDKTSSRKAILFLRVRKFQNQIFFF